jgi:uncharacterized membrane protein (Fun14 family)
MHKTPFPFVFQTKRTGGFMMDLSYNSALVAAVFGIFGFFLAFSLKKAINILLFGIFTYASLQALSYLGVQPDWVQFQEVVDLLSQLGKTLLGMVKTMLQAAALASVLCFLTGGVLGFALRR